ncbi:unnamed protein product [Effrenium voratum]|nr:unnamed protein product [Effrenium voratum]
MPEMVTFAYSRREDGTCRSQEKRTLTLGEDVLPFKGLYNVLMSMKASEVGPSEVGSTWGTWGTWGHPGERSSQ